jgi:hypothetical protein
MSLKFLASGTFGLNYCDFQRVFVLVEVGVRVGEGVTGMPRARPQAARKVAARLVRVNLRKSRRERFLFGDITQTFNSYHGDEALRWQACCYS